MKSLTKGFGIIGIILILFGVIALAVTKLMNWYVYSHLGLGVLMMILYVTFNFDQFAERLKERSTTEGSKVFVYAGVGVLIIIMLNVISFRHSWRWDLTSSKVFSLEEQTIKTLQNLKVPVQVMAFMNPSNKSRDVFKQISETYRYQNPKFSYEIIDPDKRPDLATRFQAQDGLIRFAIGSPDKTLSGFDEKGLREALGEKVKSIYYFGDSLTDPVYTKLRDLLHSPEFKDKAVNLEILSPSSPPPPTLDIKSPKKDTVYIEFVHKDTIIKEISEEAFTNAILQISRQESPVVRFSSGHGEAQLEDEQAQGLSILKNGIQNEGYVVQSMEGSLAEGVPAGTDIFVLAGPKSPLSKDEVSGLEKFLDNGGKVIMLAEPMISNPKVDPNVRMLDSGAEGLLEKWGITLGKNIIFEKHLQLLMGQVVEPDVMATKYGEHEITKPLTGRDTFFHVARSVSHAAKNDAAYRVTELVKSAEGDASWGETNLTDLVLHHRGEFNAGKDLAGPVSVMAVSERDKTLPDGKKVTAKLVVVGDVDFILNNYIANRGFNYDLFLNTLNWMWGRQEQISIRPKQMRPSKLMLTPEQTNIIFYLSVLTIPELVLIAGLIIYWRRRSR